MRYPCYFSSASSTSERVTVVYVRRLGAGGEGGRQVLHAVDEDDFEQFSPFQVGQGWMRDES